MFDVSGIPNMGFGGGGYFGGSASLGLPAMSAGQINSSMGWNPNAAAYDPWANTPGGFGAQTAYYQQAAANNYGAINAASLYGGGYAPQPDQGYGNGYGPSAQTYYNPFADYPGSGIDPWAAPTYQPAPSYDWNSYFNGLTGGAQQANPYTGAGAGYNPYDMSSYGLGASWQTPAQPSWSTLGYDPSIFGGGFQSMPAAAWGSSYYGGDQGYGNGYGPSAQTYYNPFADYPGSGIDPWAAPSYGAAASWYTPQTPDYQWGQNFWGAQPGGGIGAYGMGAGYGGFNNYGNDDFAARFGAMGGYDPNSFANRFAAGGYYGAGSPSMYYTGSQYGTGYAEGIPPSFSGLYGFDNQGGALPLEYNNWGSSNPALPGG